MKFPPAFLFVLGLTIFFVGCGNSQQQFQPEDVITTIDDHELKYKHILAYINMEMEGEDPALLQDQAYMVELTEEAIEEFGEDPEGFVADMDVHYQAMQLGGGNLQIQNSGGQANNSQPNAQGGQWKQTLTGGVLYATDTQSHEGLFVQATSYMHLCPNGNLLFYQRSGGGGGAITAPGQLEYQGAGRWDVLENGQQAFFRVVLDGVTNDLPMQVVNQQIVIQGLGALNFQPGGAQCR